MQTPNELIPDRLQMDLLWTNASPTSEFQDVSIMLELNEYKFVYVIFKVATDIDEYVSKLYKIGLVKQFCMAMNPQPRYRHTSVYNSGVQFHRSFLVTGITTESVNSSQMIPYQIYGVR